MNPGQHLATDCYKSISSPSKGLYKDKGSKFISFAFPVESESRAREIIANIKKEYFDARHHCYAWRIGAGGEQWRANDDGEPSGTAGRPILGQMLSSGLSDMLIVVVRYFGGILLGTSGLIVAYRSAAADAIANAAIVEKTATERYEISFDYSQMNAVMKYLKEQRLAPLNPQWGSQCTLQTCVPLSRTGQFLESMQKICICRKV